MEASVISHWDVTRTTSRTIYQLKALNNLLCFQRKSNTTLSTSPLKYLQVSIDAMRVLAQENELRSNTKTEETAEIEDDSSRTQEVASTPDSQNQRMYASITRRAIHQLSYSFSFAAYLVVDSMSVNDTTDALCADISYTASTSEHTPDSTILASPDFRVSR